MFSTYSIYIADTFTVSVAWWSNPLLDFPIIWSILVANHFKNLENVGKNDFLLASFYLQLTMKLIPNIGYWNLNNHYDQNCTLIGMNGKVKKMMISKT